MKNSYIIAISNTYELVTNFLEHLLKQIVDDDEIIIVTDGITDSRIIKYVLSRESSYLNMHVYVLDKQCGYAVANNYGVEKSSGDNLIFINSDVFPQKECIPVLLEKLNSSDDIGAVQPLLIYPQTNLVQSTGHLFADFQCRQVFQMRNPLDPIVQVEGSRQALSMALCVMKREIYSKFGGMNEYYFNSHEGAELTLKITLGNYKCLYCPSAIAYHCSGGSRGKMVYDYLRQKVYFYSRWNEHIKIDLKEYLSMQLSSDAVERNYCVINCSKSRIWKETLASLSMHVLNFFETNAKYETEINLYYYLPYSMLNYPGAYLFLCDNIFQLQKNYNWFKIRNQCQDLIFDLNGNVVEAKTWIMETRG